MSFNIERDRSSNSNYSSNTFCNDDVLGMDTSQSNGFWIDRQGVQSNAYDLANRGNKRFRNNSSTNRTLQRNNTEAINNHKVQKHPKHLRGREIGLWYASQQRNRDPNLDQKRNKNILEKAPLVSITSEKLEQIKMLLESPELKLFTNVNESVNVASHQQYRNIADSDFKHSFINIISGKMEDKLENYESFTEKDCPTINENFKSELKLKENDPKYMSMQAFRQKLPSFKMKDSILDAIRQNQVILISGETGCGKTTQVAQFVLDDAILSGTGSTCKVACTQPRRISAISVAERVADERNETCGQSVGYQIRLERIMPRSNGSIIFCTTGVLLKQMESDPCLNEFSHIILDEIHERDTVCDFLLTILKQVIIYRKDLKVILMSATLNADEFSKYYANCPIIHIPGYTYPVEELYLEDILQEIKFYNFQPAYSNQKRKMGRNNKNDYFQGDMKKYIEIYARNNKDKFNANVLRAIQNPLSEEVNVNLIECLISHISNTKPDGAILVFLTGLVDIGKLHTLLQDCGRYPNYKYAIYPLHSKMPTVNQKQIFQKPRPGVRKIIISTNIAETSITIDDVVYVIDCGKIKMKNYDPETNLSTLKPEWVSHANSKQRSGRAGRVQSGVCYHLYTRPRALLLEDYQKPEMLRTRIEEVILNIKILQLGDAATFLQKVLNPPDPRVVEHSIKLLQRLNALDSSETLTPLGYHLAQLPMDPQTGKMILMGALFSCIQPIFGIAASLSFKDAFSCPLGKEKEVERRKYELSQGLRSDHLVLAEALQQWENAVHSGNARQFCWNYYLSEPTLKLLKDMKKQFADHLHEMNFLYSSSLSEPYSNVNSTNISLVRAVICSGLYPNVAYIAKMKKFKNKPGMRVLSIRTQEDGRVCIHPRSINANADSFDSIYFLYHLKLKTNALYLHDTTMIYPLPLIFFGDNIETGIENEIEFISVNGIKMRCKNEIAEIILKLRKCLESLLFYKVSHPGIVNWKSSNNIEKRILSTISDLISAEDGMQDFQDYGDGSDTD